MRGHPGNPLIILDCCFAPAIHPPTPPVNCSGQDVAASGYANGAPGERVEQRPQLVCIATAVREQFIDSPIRNRQLLA